MDITLFPFINPLFLSLLFTKRRKEPSQQRPSIEDFEDDDEDVDDGLDDDGSDADDEVRCRQGWDAGQSLQEGPPGSLGCPTYNKQVKVWSMSGSVPIKRS